MSKFSDGIKKKMALEFMCGLWFVGGQEYWVPTSFGHILVTVCGDQAKPALVAYPDVGLNCKIPIVKL